MRSKTNRRQLLGAGALATAGVGAVAPETSAEPRFGGVVDVCVVGGGFAGLTAALRVRQARRSVAVIEAGPRLGGRTFTSRISDGTPFEIGGAWVSGTETQSNIMQLIAEMGIPPPFPQFTDGDSIFVRADGTAVPWVQTVDPFPPFSDDPALNEAATLNLIQLAAKITFMAEAVDLQTPWEDVQFPFEIEPGDLTGPATSRQADELTLETWMDMESLTDPGAEDGRRVLKAAFNGLTGQELAALSLLQVVWFIKSYPSPVKGLPPNLLNYTGTDPGQANAFRIQQGMGSITGAMIRRIGQNAFFTNSRVYEISQDATGVNVISERVKIRAKRVIIALATTNAQAIHFKPQLPNDRAQLQQRFPLGLIWKNWLVYDEAFWRAAGYTASTTSIFGEDFYGASLDGGPAPGDNSPGLIVAFVDADKGREYARLTRAQRKQRMIDELAHRFDAVGLGQQARQPSQRLRFPVAPQNPFPDNYFEFNWVTDEFTRGDYGAMPGPGVLTGLGFGPAIRAPIGRVHWAGVDTSTQAYGTINSAVQSGNLAAAAVLSRL